MLDSEEMWLPSLLQSLGELNNSRAMGDGPSQVPVGIDMLVVTIHDTGLAIALNTISPPICTLGKDVAREQGKIDLRREIEVCMGAQRTFSGLPEPDHPRIACSFNPALATIHDHLAPSFMAREGERAHDSCVPHQWLYACGNRFIVRAWSAGVHYNNSILVYLVINP